MEKYEQPKWSSGDNISGSGQSRSYTCTYCKRGFSNAQALGGHMNIHRRDKARLRQFCEENENDDGDGDGQVSSATMMKNKINNPTVCNHSLHEEQSASVNHVIKTRKSSEELDQKTPVLFEESIGKIDRSEEEKISAEEPDLELRLGLSSASSTRNFF